MSLKDVLKLKVVFMAPQISKIFLGRKKQPNKKVGPYFSSSESGNIVKQAKINIEGVPLQCRVPEV